MRTAGAGEVSTINYGRVAVSSGRGDCPVEFCLSFRRMTRTPWLRRVPLITPLANFLMS